MSATASDRASRDDARRRKAIVALSLLGAANMTLIAARQLGIVRHLPDPPIPGFDADKVTTSPAAHPLGIPDAPIAVAALAANVALARAGGDDRAERTPWVPIAAAAHAGAQAAVAATYFTLMPSKVKAWCAYCLVGAAINVSVFALTVPEARRAWTSARS